MTENGSNEFNHTKTVDQHGLRAVVQGSCILNGDLTPEASCGGESDSV